MSRPVSRNIPATPATVIAIAAAMVSALAFSTPASAQDDPLELVRGRQVDVTVRAGVWMPRFDGNTALGSSGVEAIDADEFDLEDLEPIFNGEVTIRFDDWWEIQVNGFDFDAAGDDTFREPSQFGAINFAAGDRFRSEVSMTSFAAEARIDILHPLRLGRQFDPAGRYIPSDFRIALVGGVRYIDFDHTASRIGGPKESASAEWIAPFAGLHLTLRYQPEQQYGFMHALLIDVGATAGTSVEDGGAFYQVRGGIGIELSPTIGLGLGYRLVGLDLEQDDLRVDASLQGLFAWASIRF